ncbi:MAG: hypothetical protein H0W60_01645 [Chloroflexi bacterium]|nr:hypothetical protein [Chloroflexota bacterium]
MPDTTLEAAFPTEIDGQPAAMQSIGVDPAAVSFASATVMVGEESLSLQALHTPGGSAAYALDALVALDPPEVAPTTTTDTIGGKQATVATLEDGGQEFFYANGDLAWLLPGADTAQAEVIFAALP